jgi:hypothetical protein
MTESMELFELMVKIKNILEKIDKRLFYLTEMKIKQKEK